MKYKDTSEVKVPERLVDQIIGQDRAVKIIRNAAKQRRHMLLIGSPGTGKSMLAQGMAELMPSEELEDVLVYPNRIDENNPVVKVVKTMPPKELVKHVGENRKSGEKKKEDLGQGRLIIEHERSKARMNPRRGMNSSMLLFGIIIVAMIALSYSGATEGEQKWIIAAAVLGLFIFGASWLLSSQISRRGFGTDLNEPKLIVDNSGKKNAPFVDATGSKAGALFGDVKHDPLQSFSPDSKFYIVRGDDFEQSTFSSLWDAMQKRYPERVEKEGEYEYITFPPEEAVYVLSEEGGKPSATRVMSMNRRPYSGKVLRVSAEGEGLATTPEHKYVCPEGEREARDVAKGDDVLSVQGD